MRISKIHQEMDVPPRKVGKNKGVRRAWKARKRADAVARLKKNE